MSDPAARHTDLIDLGVPDLDGAMDFYRSLFGWEYDVGPAVDSGGPSPLTRPTWFTAASPP